MERYKPAPKPKPNGKGNDYFPSRSLEFIDSGCTLLNCILGGGWILGRPVNIVGDKSVGKTLLAIEACANFSRQFQTGYIDYRESEAAFDVGYAESVGLPAKKVNFGPNGIDTLWDTIDQIYDDLEAQVAAAKKTARPGLYIIDSLDALTSKEEKGRDRTKGSYGQAKPKIIGELFRTQVRDMRQTRKTFMIVSQIRDKIGGLSFGETYTIAGGHSLDFYCNQRVFLKHLGKIVKTVNGLKRTTGVRIRAKCTKNKVGPSFGECEFILRYGYGIDDLMANVDWLEAVGRLNEIDVKKDQVAKFLAKSEKLEDDEYRKLVKQASVVVTKAWQQVGADFKPRHSKYA